MTTIVSGNRESLNAHMDAEADKFKSRAEAFECFDPSTPVGKAAHQAAKSYRMAEDRARARNLGGAIHWQKKAKEDEAFYQAMIVAGGPTIIGGVECDLDATVKAIYQAERSIFLLTEEMKRLRKETCVIDVARFFREVIWSGVLVLAGIAIFFALGMAMGWLVE